MTDTNETQPHPAQAPRAHTDGGRRRFLLLFPAVVGLGIFTTLARAAFRFLRPQDASATAAADARWLTVAPLAELTGAQPIARTVRVEQAAGWAQVVEEHPVLVLPQERRVLSAVCPHEGCTVIWRAEDNGFLCPCHDSRFDAAGAPTSGPAARNLAALPTQVEGGVLKIRWQTETPTEPAPLVRG
ncbi:MAG TPA: Rieske (2Fe-2S) protein [Pyrinomonadaceae bacterium]|jgi:Rieske Fe-S protein